MNDQQRNSTGLPSMARAIKLLSFILLLALASVIRAQSPLTTCATVDLDGPSEVDPGAQVIFKIRITGPVHTTKPEFKWTVSAGTITTGQGTQEITVDTVGLGGQDITATAELSGAPLGCKASFSITTQVKPPPIVCFRPFDEYGDIRFEDEKARLDNFAIQITNEPLAIGQILMFAGRETYEDEAAERLARAKSYMVNVRGVDQNRILTNDCGFRGDLSIRLVMIPAGIAPLTCDDSLQVPFAEVKFTKPRPKSSKNRR
jgi:hypothetical protein